MCSGNREFSARRLQHHLSFAVLSVYVSFPRGLVESIVRVSVRRTGTAGAVRCVESQRLAFSAQEILGTCVACVERNGARVSVFTAWPCLVRCGRVAFAALFHGPTNRPLWPVYTGLVSADGRQQLIISSLSMRTIEPRLVWQ